MSETLALDARPVDGGEEIRGDGIEDLALGTQVVRGEAPSAASSRGRA